MIAKTHNIRRFLIWALLVPPVISALVTTGSVVYLVQNLLVKQEQNSVAGHLRSAREIYDGRLRHIEETAHFVAGQQQIRLALNNGDLDGLRRELQLHRQFQGEDIITAVDAAGKVLARARLNGLAGDDVSFIAPVGKALSGQTVSSTEILDSYGLMCEGPDLARQAAINLVKTPYAEPSNDTVNTQGLVLLGASPVTGDDGRVLGAIYVGHLINRDYSLVDKIKETVFPQTGEGEALAGKATIFLNDVRVSTNVSSATAGRAIGTRVSSEVAQKVLVQGTRWIDRAFVVDQWYLSAYEPLRNLRGDTVGIIYVGVLEAPFKAIMWQSIGFVALFHIIGTLLALAFAVFCYRWLGAQLGILVKAAKRIAEGELDSQIPHEWDDELGELTDEFNKMTLALKARIEDNEALNRDLDKKVRERSAELESRNAELITARQNLLELMEQQKNTNEELAQSLKKLRQTQEELIRSGKLSALGTMAAGVAHEINTPLAVIQGNVDILKLQSEKFPEIEEEIELITEQAARMQKIVGRLLAFARKDEGELTRVDLNSSITQTLRLVETQAKKNRVEVTTHYFEGLPQVVANNDRLIQVFTNLVVNSLQAMEHGGRLTITTGISDDQKSVFASFSDTGPGISQSDRESVWNPFFTTKAGGTGLGLSIAHTIVEDHGGKLLLESEPGEGTTFKVVLPI